MTIKKIFSIMVLGLLCTFFWKEYGSAKPIDSTTLLNDSFKYDGKIIDFQGEAIGEIMKRGKYAWVNINDGQNAIGVFMKYEDAKKIKYLGRYRVKGDIILVRGIFNRSCKVHGGDVDIHALDIKIIKQGYKMQEKINTAKAVFAVIIFSVGSFLMWIVFRNRW